MATNATINHLAFHGSGYNLVGDTLNVTVFSEQGTAGSLPSYSKASTMQDGLMSKEDKTKLDNFKNADQYVTVVSGKDLSTNDFTNAYKNQLDNLASNPPTVDTSQLVTKTELQTAIDNVTVDTSDFITDDQLQLAINESTVDTSNFVTSSQLTTAINSATVDTSNFVVKDGTKVLSDVNYTQAEKTKLSNIADNAQVNKIESIKVDGSALSITNKSVNIVLTGKVDTVAGKQLSTNDFTDAYKNKVDGSTVKASASQDGLMSKENYTKLNGIAEGANNFTLNKATSSSLGGVKIVEGHGLYMDGDTLKVNTNEAQGDFSIASTTASGLMSSADKQALESLKAITNATTVKAGYMSTSDKIKLNGIDTLYATKSEVSTAVASLYKFKGSVNSFSALPNNANVGDVYNIQTAGGTDVNGNSIKAGDNVAKVSNGWDVLAGTIDLSGYATTVLASTVSPGLMSSSDKTKLNNLPSTVFSGYTKGSTIDISGDANINDGHGGLIDMSGIGTNGVGGSINLSGDREAGSINMSGIGTNGVGGTINMSGKGSGGHGSITGDVNFTGTPYFKHGFRSNDAIELKTNDYGGVPIASDGSTPYTVVGGFINMSSDNGYGGTINMFGSTTGGTVDAHGTNEGGYIDLSGKKGGTVYMRGSSVGGSLDMSGVNKGGTIILSGTGSNNPQGGTIELGNKGSLLADGAEIHINYATVVGGNNTSIQGNVQFIGKPNFTQSATGISLQSGEVNIPTAVYDSIMGNFTLTGNETSLAYSLPTASNTVKGGIMVGDGLSMSGDTLSVPVIHDNMVDLNGTEIGGTIRANGTGLSGMGGTLELKGNTQGGVIDLTGSYLPGQIKGDVVFVGKPTFQQGANGLVSSIPTASNTVKGGVKVGKALKMTNESIGVDTLDADDVYIATTDFDSIMNQFTVSSAVPDGLFTNKVSLNGGFNVPDSVSSSFGSHDTVTFGNFSVIDFGHSASIKNGANAYLKFMDKVDFQNGFKMANSVSADIGNRSSIISDYSYLDLKHSEVKLSYATVTGDPVFANRISFNEGFTAGSNNTIILGQIAKHNTVQAEHTELQFGNSTITGLGITFAKGFDVADSVSTDLGNYNTLSLGVRSKLDIKNYSTVLADHSLVDLSNGTLKFNSSNVTGSPKFIGSPKFTGSPEFAGNPKFTGTPTFSNGISSSTVYIPTSVYNDLMNNFITVSSAKSEPTIVFNPASISTRTNTSPYSFSYTITSDATSHSHYMIDSYESDTKFYNETVSGLTGTMSHSVNDESGDGTHTYFVTVPETTNYTSKTFVYQVYYSVDNTPIVRQAPSIVFNPTSIDTITNLNTQSFSYTITSDATYHYYIGVDSATPTVHAVEETVSGLTGTIQYIPKISNGKGNMNYTIIVPKTDNYDTDGFHYNLYYDF